MQVKSNCTQISSEKLFRHCIWHKFSFETFGILKLSPERIFITFCKLCLSDGFRWISLDTSQQICFPLSAFPLPPAVVKMLPLTKEFTCKKTNIIREKKQILCFSKWRFCVGEVQAIPENRELKKWKFSFCPDNAYTNVLTFVVTYRKKLNFHFWFSPIFGLCRKCTSFFPKNSQNSTCSMVIETTKIQFCKYLYSSIEHTGLRINHIWNRSVDTMSVQESMRLCFH